MSDKSDTPETDFLLGDYVTVEQVIDHARKFERGRNEARKEAARWRDAHASYYHAPKPKLPWEKPDAETAE